MSFFPHLRRVRGHTLWTASLGPGSVVIDAGAHRGEFSAEIHSRFACRCLLIEANPDLAAGLIAPEGGKVIEAALAQADGASTFFFSDNPEGGGITARACAAGGKSSIVNTLSLETLGLTAGLEQIDLLKLDIEGSEFGILETTSDDTLSRIAQITVEFHDFLPAFSDPALFQRARRRLEGLGFSTCVMSIRGHGDVLFLNRKRLPLSRLTRRMIRWLGPSIIKLRDLKRRNT